MSLRIPLVMLACLLLAGGVCAATTDAAGTLVSDRPLPEGNGGLSASAPSAAAAAVVQPLPEVVQDMPSPAPVTKRDFAGFLLERETLLALLGGLTALLLLILVLLFRRARPSRQGSAQPAGSLLIQHEWADLYAPQGAPGESTAATDSGEEPLSFQQKLKEFAAGQLPEDGAPLAAGIPLPRVDLNLVGRLSSAQVPAMLQFIASTNRPGTLVIRSEFSEKRLTFHSGKIIAASTVNLKNLSQAGFLMNKLGYLLVRQGKISEDDRDQALALCDSDPTLRLGEALIKLGKIKREQLRTSLREQAVMVLHSMIVFPEGDYQFVPGDVKVAARDSLDIKVSEFLKEAATHQGEWRNIRQMISSLDAILDFTPEGKDKLSSGRMTVHQKFVLSLVNGQRPIREICNEATMLDYELYRFLYLMVRAQILEVVKA